MRSAFHDDDEWKNELRAIAMSMIESSSVVLTATSQGFVDLASRR